MIEHRYEVQILEDINRFKKDAKPDLQWVYWNDFDTKERAISSKNGIKRSGWHHGARVVFASRLTVHKVIE
jgi:hypothetical protein